MGVVPTKNGKFRARYSLNGQRVNVGTFDTRLKAVRALNDHRRLNTPKPTQEGYDPDQASGLAKTPEKVDLPPAVTKPNALQRGLAWLKSHR